MRSVISVVQCEGADLREEGNLHYVLFHLEKPTSEAYKMLKGASHDDVMSGPRTFEWFSHFG